MIKLRLTLGSVCCVSTAGPLSAPLARGAEGIAYSTAARDGSPAAEVKETVRKYFPETWIWDLVKLK